MTAARKNLATKKGKSPIAIMALEPRFMFDAAGMATVSETVNDPPLPDGTTHEIATADSKAVVAADSQAAQSGPAQEAPPAVDVAAPAYQEVRLVDPAQNDDKKEVIFIESNVPDYQTLIDGVKPGIEVVLLDASKDGLAAMIDRQGALADNADQIGVLKEELRTVQALAVGVAALQAQLTITAPFDGRLTDLADPLRPGQWVRPEQTLGRMASIDRRRVTAFIAADDLSRVEAGASARFISDDPAAQALPLRLDEIASANADALDAPLLSARFGGPIPTAPVKGQKGAAQERPTAPIYRAVLTPVDQNLPNLPPQTLAGRVFIDAPSQSLIRRGWSAAAAVLIRESGF